MHSSRVRSARLLTVSYASQGVLVVVMGLKWQKMYQKLTMLVFFAILRPVTTIKTLKKYFYLVEEVPSFDLVGHM